MKDYFENPHGSFNSYRDKTLELVDKHKHLCESLRVMFGVDLEGEL
jgi:hypothetical protein